MLALVIEHSFEKDIKQYRKKHYPLGDVYAIIEILESGKSLNGRYHDHALTGNAGYRELHIEQNILLIYKIDGEDLILVRFGSHDELFK
jgi:mRNA interferase YafQ